MKTINLKLIAIIAGTILFSVAFWQQQMGLNVLVYAIFILLVLKLVYKNAFTQTTQLAVGAGVLISALVITWHASVFAKLMFIVSVLLLPGVMHTPQLKTVFVALVQSIVNYFTSYKISENMLQQKSKGKAMLSGSIRFIKIAIIPVILLIIFYQLFKFANPVFYEMSADVFASVSDFLTRMFGNFPFLRVLFTLWGLSIITGLLYQSKLRNLVLFENRFTEFLSRTVLRNNSLQLLRARVYNPLTMKLKNEYRSAYILMLSINILLLVVNIIDISWIWIGFKYTRGFDLKQFVHEGTYLLIISILLSMSIMMYYFRGNLNFYPLRKRLEWLAYFWIFQNAILVISVVLRNLHYITYFGLAYKRIGVIIFLVLTGIGLVTLLIKIRNRRSGFYLWRVNGWALYVVLILASVVNWDFVIATVNTNHPLKNNIETSFLLQLSDKSLYIIDKNANVLNQPEDFNVYQHFYGKTYNDVYTAKVNAFMKKMDKRTFWSYNYAELTCYRYLKQKYGKTAIKPNNVAHYIPMFYLYNQAPTNHHNFISREQIFLNSFVNTID